MLSSEKCSLLLGNKCTAQAGQEVAIILDVQTVGFEEKYLGLPVPEGRMKNGKFQPVKEKIKKRLTDYSEKYASSGAKETLIKSMVQAISTYPMSVFKFSAGLCEELMKITRDFLWGDENDCRRMHWMSWDNLTKRKGQGEWEWDLETYIFSIKLSWRGKLGDLLLSLIAFVLDC
jgi:hypothetical protein